MLDMYAVKVDLIVDGFNKTRYVGPSTRLSDPASYVSSYAAKLWKKKAGAERYITQHADSLPPGARVVTISA